MNPYLAAFKVDMEIQIIDSQMPEIFMRSWCCHNRLQSEQLSFAEKIARVAKLASIMEVILFTSWREFQAFGKRNA